jgi:hypothetical protein
MLFDVCVNCFERTLLGSLLVTRSVKSNYLLLRFGFLLYGFEFGNLNKSMHSVFDK